MDLVLVGLPGSGKTAVGRRLARRHGAAFVDLDEEIERDAGRPIAAIRMSASAATRGRSTVREWQIVTVAVR